MILVTGIDLSYLKRSVDQPYGHICRAERFIRVISRLYFISDKAVYTSPPPHAYTSASLCYSTPRVTHLCPALSSFKKLSGKIRYNT